jgi:hypothetical protein
VNLTTHQTGPHSHGRHHRHPGREGHRKRGRSRDPVGYDAGKKVKGIKRNAVVDTVGLLLGIEAIPASVQDRDGASALIKKTRRLFPFVRHVFADGGYSGDKLAADLAAQKVTLEIVKRTDKEGGFKLIRRLRQTRDDIGYAQTLDRAKTKACNMNF